MRARTLLAAAFLLSLTRSAIAQSVAANPFGVAGLNVGQRHPVGFGGLNVGSDLNQIGTPGVRVSDSLIVHSSVAVGAGYDSNIFYQDTSRTGAGMLQVLPSLGLTNGGRGAAPNVYFSLTGNMVYRQYLSDEQFVKDRGTAFGTGTAALLDIGTQSHVGLTLFANFIRDVQVSYQPGTLEFVQDFLQPGARLRWRPGGGRLDMLLTYLFQYNHFEGGLNVADVRSQFVSFHTNFRFLPKTAVYIDVNQGLVHYINGSPAVGKFDGKPFRAVAGLSGLITSRMTAEVYAGYGNTFYDVGPNASAFLGGASLGWLLGPFSRLKLGYEHNFNNSIYGNYYDLDSGYLAWNQQVGTSVVGALGARLEHRTYHCVPGTMNATIQCFQDPTGSDRVDNWVSLLASLDFYPKPWFSLGLNYQLLANVSDFRSGPMGDSAQFLKNQVMGVVAVNY